VTTITNTDVIITLYVTHLNFTIDTDIEKLHKQQKNWWNS